MATGAKAKLSAVLRAMRLLRFADSAQFLLQNARLGRRNKAFARQHPGFAFPPAYASYESYGMDYASYYRDGKETAAWIIDHFRRHLAWEGGDILDWGCGPGRVIRHFPDLLPTGFRFFGSDYNASTIRWCSAKIPGVAFGVNGLRPPLPHPTGRFIAVYGISVLTHLSSDLQPAWLSEIRRILRKDGMAFLTTHGRLHRDGLIGAEKARFDAGLFVARGHVKNGHRTFTAFHPPAYMQSLLRECGLEVVEHREGSPEPGECRQDIWIVKTLN